MVLENATPLEIGWAITWSIVLVMSWKVLKYSSETVANLKEKGNGRLRTAYLMRFLARYLVYTSAFNAYLGITALFVPPPHSILGWRAIANPILFMIGGLLTTVLIFRLRAWWDR